MSDDSKKLEAKGPVEHRPFHFPVPHNSGEPIALQPYNSAHERLVQQSSLPPKYKLHALAEMKANPHYAHIIAVLYTCLYSPSLAAHYEANLQRARSWFVKTGGSGRGISEDLQQLPSICQGLQKLQKLGFLELPWAQYCINDLFDLPVDTHYSYEMWVEQRVRFFNIFAAACGEQPVGGFAGVIAAEQQYFQPFNSRGRIHINLVRLAGSPCGVEFFEVFKQLPAAVEDVFALSWQWDKCGLLAGEQGRRNVLLLANKGLARPLRQLWEQIQYVLDPHPNRSYPSKNAVEFPPLLQASQGQAILNQIAALAKNPTAVVVAANVLQMLPTHSSPEGIEKYLSQIFSSPVSPPENKSLASFPSDERQRVMIVEVLRTHPILFSLPIEVLGLVENYIGHQMEATLDLDGALSYFVLRQDKTLVRLFLDAGANPYPEDNLLLEYGTPAIVAAATICQQNPTAESKAILAMLLESSTFGKSGNFSHTNKFEPVLATIFSLIYPPVVAPVFVTTKPQSLVPESKLVDCLPRTPQLPSSKTRIGTLQRLKDILLEDLNDCLAQAKEAGLTDMADLVAIDDCPASLENVVAGLVLLNNQVPLLPLEFKRRALQEMTTNPAYAQVIAMIYTCFYSKDPPLRDRYEANLHLAKNWLVRTRGFSPDGDIGDRIAIKCSLLYRGLSRLKDCGLLNQPHAQSYINDMLVKLPLPVEVQDDAYEIWVDEQKIILGAFTAVSDDRGILGRFFNKNVEKSVFLKVDSCYETLPAWQIDLTDLARSAAGAELFTLVKQFPALAKDMLALSWLWKKEGLLEGKQGQSNVQQLKGIAEKGLTEAFRMLYERMLLPPKKYTVDEKQKFLDQLFKVSQKDPSAIFAAVRILNMLPADFAPEKRIRYLQQIFSSVLSESKAAAQPQDFKEPQRHIDAKDSGMGRSQITESKKDQAELAKAQTLCAAKTVSWQERSAHILFAVENDLPATVVFYLDNGSLRVNYSKYGGEGNFLHYAVGKGCIEVSRVMLERCPSPIYHSGSALGFAVLRKDPKLTQLLLDYGAYPQALHHRPTGWGGMDLGVPAIYCALEVGAPREILSMLLKSPMLQDMDDFSSRASDETEKVVKDILSVVYPPKVAASIQLGGLSQPPAQPAASPQQFNAGKP